MDDCDLEKLTLAPAKLSPKFSKNTTEYTATVPSSVEKVKVDCLTSDSGASYQIVGSGGEKVIPLKEGTVTEIKIEVTAEDGTVKNYFINIKRLSASDAILSSLAMSEGKLDPVFDMEEIEYTCVVSCTNEEITVKATAPDKKCEILVNGGDLETPTKLNVGETMVTVTVKSVDGKNTKDYIVLVSRKQLLWPLSFADSKLATKYECPMTLAPLYCPISIKDSEPKVIMSQKCIDMLTRRSKVNPFDESLLDPGWRAVEFDLDKEISGCLMKSVYSYKGCNEEVTLCKLAMHASKHELKPKQEVNPAIVTGSDWYKAEFESSSSDPAAGFSHSITVRNWEKRLQHMASEMNVDKLVANADKHIKKYQEKLPKKAGDVLKYNVGDSPVDHLHQACICCAAAVKGKPKDGKLHLKLAMALEEKYYLQDMYGLEKMEDDDAAGTNMSARESSKDEECTAICSLRGVGPSSPIALQLKAIDEEYHALLDSGQSGKADHVMALYAWKSKQALKSGQTASKAADDSNPLGQAYVKYLDALSINVNDFVFNLHVGRMMLSQDDHKGALQRLQQAVGLKPSNIVARFYLGLALYTQAGGPGARLKESLVLLHEGFEHLLLKRLEEAEAQGDIKISSTDLISEDPWRHGNIQILRGFYTLAKALESNPQDGFFTSRDIYHCICLHASTVLYMLHARNDLYKQLEWLIMDCHYSLLELMMKEKNQDEDWIAQRCRYLSCVIRNVTILQNDELLQLQEKVCQKLVSIQPCNSNALYLLGMAQLNHYDNDPRCETAERSLKDARLSFHASIALEGKPASGNILDGVTNQKWWQDRLAAEQAKKAAQEKPQPAAATKGRGAARGPARGAPASKGRAGPARGAAQTRGAQAVRARAGATTARGARGGRGATAATVASSNSKCEKQEDTSKEVKESSQLDAASVSTPSGKPAPINRKTRHARLGLARALSRTADHIGDARKMYEEVITMAPQIHDAYIELAEILSKSDPLAAVDVYCKFPRSSDENSFDDAYLSGEIVQILMKHEKYDDPRLCEHMISWGRVMGIGVLEKHMGILDAKFKTEMLKNIYAGVHRKNVKDSDLEAFFKFKCWI